MVRNPGGTSLIGVWKVCVVHVFVELKCPPRTVPSDQLQHIFVNALLIKEQVENGWRFRKGSSQCMFNVQRL